MSPETKIPSTVGAVARADETKIDSNKNYLTGDSIMTQTARKVKPIRASKNPETITAQAVTPSIESNETARLNERHYDELVNRSAIREDIAFANFKSVVDYQVAAELGFGKGQGVEGFAVMKDGKPFQFKPDVPTAYGKSKKPDRYRIKYGFNPILFPHDPKNPNRWDEVLSDPSRAVIVTEGMKKACSLVSLGYDAVATLGIFNGYEEGDIHRALMPYLGKGRKVYVAFDSDAGSNKLVGYGVSKFAAKLKTHNVDVSVMEWSEVQGKGIDDYIVKNGAKSVESLIDKAVPVLEYLKRGVDVAKIKLPAQSVIAAQFAEDVRGIMRYQSDLGMWRVYEGGKWTYYGDDMVIKRNVKAFLDTHLEVLGNYNAYYLAGTVDLLKTELYTGALEKPKKGLINFRNGVYDRQTKQVTEHAPGYNFSYILPYDYDPTATIPLEIEDAFYEWADGSYDMVQVLFAWINVVLLGRNELQRFLSITGTPGSGKSTYAELVSEIAGASNVAAMNLKYLNDKFEMQRAVGKTLLLFEETEAYVESLKPLAAMVTSNSMRIELKNRNSLGTSLDNYKSEGVSMLVSNRQVKSIDDEGILRRILPIVFKNKVGKADIHFKAKLFAAIPGIVNRALSMSDEEVEQLIGQTQIYAPSLTNTYLEKALESSTIGEWMADYLILDPDSFTPSGTIEDVQSLLGSYMKWAVGSGEKRPLSKSNLTKEIQKIMQALNIPFVSQMRSNSLGRGFKGLRLRTTTDIEPSLDEQVVTLRGRESLKASDTFESSEVTPTATSFYDGFRFAVGTEIQGKHTDGKSVVTGKVAERLASLKEGRKYYRLDSGTSYYPHDIWEDEAALSGKQMNIYEQQQNKTGGKRTL